MIQQWQEKQGNNSQSTSGEVFFLLKGTNSKGEFAGAASPHAPILKVAARGKCIVEGRRAGKEVMLCDWICSIFAFADRH